MKRLQYFFLTIILVGATFIMSCNKSSSTSVNVPTIHFITGTGYTSSDQTVQISTPLLFGISATAGDGQLSRFLVIRTFQGKTTTAKDSSFSATSFNYDLHTVAMGTVGTETWVFTIFDNNGGSSAVTLTITTTPPTSTGHFFTYSTKVHIAQTNKYDQCQRTVSRYNSTYHHGC
jgi:hypothetical protein